MSGVGSCVENLLLVVFSVTLDHTVCSQSPLWDCGGDPQGTVF